MRRLCVPILWTTALTAACAHADEFSWQISGGVRESDLGQSVEAESGTLAATYFFRPVDDADGPYALAPFLERSSNLGASYSEDKTTTVVPGFTYAIPFLPPQPPTPPVTNVTRGAARSLSGRHVWRATGWYAGASLAETDVAAPAPLSTSFSVLGDELNSASLEFGKYVGPSTAVELSLDAAKTSLTSEIPLLCTSLLCSILAPAQITTTLETDLENVEVSAFHVGRLGRLRYSLAGGITTSEVTATLDVAVTPLTLPTVPTVPAFLPVRPVPIAGGVALGSGSTTSERSERSERTERYALAGELFPTQRLGIRLGYARWDGDEPLGETYELDATWFFKPSIGARVALSRAKSDLPVSTTRDVDTVALQLIGRL